MYATIGRYEGVGASAGDLAQAGRRLAVALGGIPGFVSCAVVLAGDGALTAVAVFDEQVAVQDAERLAAAWAAEHLAGRPPGAPQITTGEVIDQKGL